MAKTEGNINTWLDQIHNKYKTAVSVDCVIFGYDETGLKVLLIPCDMPPFENKLSLLGDIVHPNETTDQAAHRVLHKRTDLDDIYLEQVHVFSDLRRHPLGRVITVSYYSLIKINGNSFMELKDNHSLQWKNVSEIYRQGIETGNATFQQEIPTYTDWDNGHLKN